MLVVAIRRRYITDITRHHIGNGCLLQPVVATLLVMRASRAGQHVRFVAYHLATFARRHGHTVLPLVVTSLPLRSAPRWSLSRWSLSCSFGCRRRCCYCYAGVAVIGSVGMPLWNEIIRIIPLRMVLSHTRRLVNTARRTTFIIDDIGQVWHQYVVHHVAARTSLSIIIYNTRYRRQ